MPYAEVSVNSPIARRQTFSYTIPSGLSIDIGQAVWVPFGDKVLQGIVLELNQYPSVEQTREIVSVIDDSPLISPNQAELARWLSEYYLCPIFEAIALMLPPGFERKTITYISATLAAENYDLSSLSMPQRKVMEAIRKQGRITQGQLERLLGKKRARETIPKLAASKLITKRYQIEPERIKPKEGQLLNLAVNAEKAKQVAAKLYEKRAAKQAALLDLLIASGSISRNEAIRKSGCQAGTIQALEKKGFILVKTIELMRQPIDYRSIKQSPPLKPTTKQQEAIEAITKSLQQNKGTTFLIHGVTGSGKTEVYLQALASAIKQGKKGIVLVPEISLTPQTIERFAGRFPQKVAVIHSRLSLGEQFDQWRQIRDGRFDVVIGVRSAVFAPLVNPGLIIIDEEHEWSYKQNTSPRYHARSVALKIAELNKAVVVLGSATPDLETYYNTQSGDHKLIELPERITPKEGSDLPHVELVDMKAELKAGNKSIFSRSLKKAIEKAINNREQVILFFNRRGAANFVQCRSCGLVMLCRRCQVSLKYHLTDDILVCHQCNYRLPVLQSCPHCQSQRIKFIGFGTQKLERETALFFPRAKVLRWDSDIIRSKYKHQEILNSFRKHEADILIGTQMITKGLDLPLVTLVGVVSADTELNLPDFRAGERSFQLISQVAGRAGRGVSSGKVIIQTFYPQHYAIQASIRHDYTSFYNKEISYRRQLHNPPFSGLVRLIYSHTNNAHCQSEAERMKRQLIAEIDTAGISDINLIGPAPAFIQRLRGKFRWQLILRGIRVSTFLSRLDIPLGWVVDVDPLGLA
ncbi:MAG: primosomal protein N' [Dehalococcoidia bacterium]|nr:MAG: primosomal protein N' [Dehalococcoidia bacterium]